MSVSIPLLQRSLICTLTGPPMPPLLKAPTCRLAQTLMRSLCLLSLLFLLRSSPLLLSQLFLFQPLLFQPPLFQPLLFQPLLFQLPLFQPLLFQLPLFQPPLFQLPLSQPPLFQLPLSQPPLFRFSFSQLVFPQLFLSLLSLPLLPFFLRCGCSATALSGRLSSAVRLPAPALMPQLLSSRFASPSGCSARVPPTGSHLFFFS